MNQFGRQAMTAWEEMAPAALSQLEDPMVFFRDLGERAQAAWLSLSVELIGPDSPGEDYFGKVGRIQEAKMAAREMIVRQWCLPPAEAMEQESRLLP